MREVGILLPRVVFLELGVAVGRLMRLDYQQMAWALGHATTLSSGLVASLGSMAKSLNIAHACTQWFSCRPTC
jgi:2-methylcitrate dehydratase PrpD